VTVAFDSTKPTMIPKRMIDINKIKDLTGWYAKTDLVDGISQTVDWYREFFATQTPEEVEK
jgi:GDP-L-fucose synthase